jgi:ABC-type uncharacterized transport system permease subunit
VAPIIKSKLYSTSQMLVSIFLSFALALFIGGVIIELTGESALNTYKVLVNGAFVGKNNISETLIKSGILLLTGLSYAFVAECGLINIGAEGQLYIGAACSTAVGIYWTFLPGPLHMIVALLAGFLGGMVWGGIVGFFKAKFGANEIIISLMMNYIAALLVSYLVHAPMKDMTQTYPYSYRIADSAKLPRLLEGTRLHAGVIVAFVCLIIYWFYYKYTSRGYRMRVIGQNRLAAEYAGYNVRKNIFVAMMIGGGFAGLGGALEILGIQYRLFDNFSSGYGFDGISAALLANSNPAGMALTSILFGGLRNGGLMIQMRTNVSSTLTSVVQSLVIILVLMKVFNRLPIWRKKKEIDITGKRSSN